MPVGTGTGAPGPSVGRVRIKTFLLPSVRSADNGTTALLTATEPSGLMVMVRWPAGRCDHTVVDRAAHIASDTVAYR